MSNQIWTGVIALVTTAACGGDAAVTNGTKHAASALAAPASSTLLSSDDFETSPTSWGIFEEVVNGSTCYSKCIGSVEQSVEQAQSGSGSLRVFANIKGSQHSNHVIAQNKLSTANVDGHLRYTVWALVDPQAGDGFHEGQTGPELSMQRTRSEPGGWRTLTAGLQYVANKWGGQGTWNLWTTNGPGNVGWVSIPDTKLTPVQLTPGQWYKIVLDVDYGTSQYLQVSVNGPGVSFTPDLTKMPHAIVHEVKFLEDAFWITVEDENAWHACDQAFEPFEYRTYYDSLTLERL